MHATTIAGVLLGVLIHAASDIIILRLEAERAGAFLNGLPLLSIPGSRTPVEFLWSHTKREALATPSGIGRGATVLPRSCLS